MAIGVPFDGQNLILGPPAGQEQDVYPLPVNRSNGAVVSCWRLSADELAEVARTGVIWLSIAGSTHPPVFLSGRRADVLGP